MAETGRFLINNGVLEKYFGEEPHIVIPDGVTSIGGYAFEGCTSLESINIPDSVTSIGDRAFEDCWGLKSINIPDGVTEIGESAFAYCTILSQISLSENNPYFTIRDRMLLGNGGTKLILWLAEDPDDMIWDDETCEYISSESDSLTIPEGVTIIGEYAFANNDNLTTVIIPDGVTEIGERAFSWCKNLTSVILPEGLQTIGYRAFEYCENLTTLIVPHSVTNIECNAFLDVPHIIYHGKERECPDEYDSWNYNTNWGALEKN